MSDIVPNSKSTLYSWKHPDPRLARSIANSSAIGMPLASMAAVFQVDERDLKRHYAPELEHGKDMLKKKLVEKALEMAMDGDDKMLRYALDKFVGFENSKKKAKAPEEEEIPSLPREGLDLSKLTLEQIKQLQHLMEIAKPSIVVQGKVVNE